MNFETAPPRASPPTCRLPIRAGRSLRSQMIAAATLFLADRRAASMSVMTGLGLAPADRGNDRCRLMWN
jgi:hypothetical protein